MKARSWLVGLVGGMLLVLILQQIFKVEPKENNQSEATARLPAKSISSSNHSQKSRDLSQIPSIKTDNPALSPEKVSVIVSQVPTMDKAKADDMTKLVLDYPKPLFAGTPKSIKTPNLERSPSSIELYVPSTVRNIALNRPVSSSDDFPVIGELSYITNGDKEGSDGSYVELGPGTQWIQIDLGASKSIYAIALWHYHAQSRAYRDVIIQASDDPEFIENVQTLFNNDHNNSSGLGSGTDKEYLETNKGKLLDAKGILSRYVRLYSNGSTGSDMNHYIEIEVFGE
jgi:hypothetical protein